MPDRPDVPDAQPDPGYDSAGVPTFDSVREKIETRYGSALGSSELASESQEGRDVEEQFEERERKAAERLAQIRESMRTDE
jgi:phage shock protein A